MKQLPKALQTLAGVGLCALAWGVPVVPILRADAAPADQAQAPVKHVAHAKKAKKSKDKEAPPSAADATPAAPVVAQPPAPPPEPPFCRLNEPEQPRGGRIDVLGDRFGSAPVVRIAGKAVRILLRKQDRISVQIPADSDGGEITLLNAGKMESCGTLVIIGKNRE